MNFSFHPAAEAEHLEQIAWFEEQQIGLGRRYLTEVESAIARACATPRQYRVEYAPDVRRIAVRGFPFEMLFRAIAMIQEDIRRLSAGLGNWSPGRCSTFLLRKSFASWTRC